MTNELISQTEAARIVGKSLSTISEAIARGKITTTRVGRRRLVDRNEVLAYFGNGKTKNVVRRVVVTLVDEKETQESLVSISEAARRSGRPAESIRLDILQGRLTSYYVRIGKRFARDQWLVRWPEHPPGAD